MAVSREIRGSQEDAQNQRDIPRMIELEEKSLAFLSRRIFAPPTSQRFSRSLQKTHGTANSWIGDKRWDESFPSPGRVILVRLLVW
jgi:hypothetical protein